MQIDKSILTSSDDAAHQLQLKKIMCFRSSHVENIILDNIYRTTHTTVKYIVKQQYKFNGTHEMVSKLWQTYENS